MGQKKKIGKQRKDKFYQLAKETGFRSRAAFKLIQLNRKFEFLQKSQVCVDLCAAPGGWMQVAKNNMPISSVVIGVDLFPIKPIPGCISLIGDITTDQCRVAIQKELQTWKADIVLHDGAPNVGKNWLHDAFQQACLTLSSIKLATHLLKRGGWFITKVFRSSDYNALIWVLKQLFKKVHATKPQASRTESAEIFLVCQYYIAPDKIDARFLDPKYVFKELELEPKNKINIYHPEKQKKAKAEGYAENSISIYQKIKASEFIQHDSGIDLLKNATEIVFDDLAILEHVKTSDEIKQCCKDILSLGKKDIRSLLSWRKVLHEEFQKKDAEEKTEPETVVTEIKLVEDEDDDDLQDIDAQITELQAEELREQKRKKKKVQKERNKLNKRLNLKMVLKNDDGPVMESDGMFSLNDISNSKELNLLLDQPPDVIVDSDDDFQRKPVPKYTKYNKEDSRLDSTGTYYKDSDSDSELEMETDNEEEEIKEGLGFEDDDDERPITKEKNTKSSKKKDNPLITDLDYRDKEMKEAHKAELFFSRDAFKNIITEFDDLDNNIKKLKKKEVTIIGEENDNKLKEKTKKKKDLKVKSVKDSIDSDNSSEERSDNDSDTDSDTNSDSDYDVEKEVTVNTSEKDGFEIVKTSGKRKVYNLTPEELALGSVMVNSKKARRDIEDASYHRYNSNDEGLPKWFVEEEKKHNRRHCPVPPHLEAEYKKTLGELKARPINKVVEAKARKKKRALKKMEKAKKKVEALMDNADLNEAERNKQIKQLYKKARQEPRQEIKYVVAKKHMVSGKKVPRPKGVKGRYKVVDPRMKKDLRAQKNKLKTMGRGKKSGGKGNSKMPRGNKRKKGNAN